MSHKNPPFNFMATGIGSIPTTDAEAACTEILQLLPRAPYWPQLVKRSHLEDMNIQFSEGLPLLKIKEEKRALFVADDEARESALVEFYDRFLSQDIERFAISPEFASGLYVMLDLLKKENGAEKEFIKGQSVGPVTFAAGITHIDGKAVLHDPELREALVNGLAIKALWQVRELAKSGRRPIIFLDEPYLSGFGSAFSPIQRHEVIEILSIVISYLRENSNALIGIHCCGNTDWSMLLEAGPDIINFDASDYMEHFLLYRKELVRFIQKGGTIAWGIVPTSNLTGDESVERLSEKLRQGLGRVKQWGITPSELAERSMLTPACGMGTMRPNLAKKCMELLSNLCHCLP